MFSGTVRENLDPCGHHPDSRLLEALEHCHLSPVINRIGERVGGWERKRGLRTVGGDCDGDRREMMKHHANERVI